ncbi:tetratricopeptide repeat protein [Anthocerotibacter panamensis]|uniref:tetratricopeptide repeat protein n=1 Tax=Anthocerotibacter panamensis TaxID=2857077 RepID=UPI001C40359B|nr:tetratricopeptide repeat protein [Anthocerotibacter panamensis]
MKRVYLAGFLLSLGMVWPALAQEAKTPNPQGAKPEKLRIKVGVEEERPQFLPDSENLVIPENIQQLEKKVKADPKNVDLKFDLLMAYSRTSLLDKAWPVALDIDKLDPEYTLKTLKTTEAQLKKNPKDQDARYRSAMASFARGLQLKEDAREKYMEPHRRGEPLPEHWWDDFKSYLQTGDKETAQRLNRPEVTAMLDEVRSRRTDAEGQLKEILKQDQDQIWAKNYLAFLSFDRGDLKQAEVLIHESIAKDPQNPISHLALGQLYLKQGQFKEFVEQVKVAFQLRAQGK